MVQDSAKDRASVQQCHQERAGFWLQILTAQKISLIFGLWTFAAASGTRQ